MLGIDEIRDTIHRAWTVERNHGHDILDTRWLELFDVLGHLRALELEDTRCLTTCQQVERLSSVAKPDGLAAGCDRDGERSGRHGAVDVERRESLSPAGCGFQRPQDAEHR